jgi:hypothetical protein
MQTETPTLSRRRFLLAAGAGAAAATAAHNPGTPASPTRAQGREKTDSGYRDSAHVRAYYRTARI